MPTILVLLLFILIILLIVGLIKPTLFTRIFKQRANRKNLALIFGGLSVILFSLIAILTSTPKTETKAITQKPTSSEESLYGILFQGALVEATLHYAEAMTATQALSQNSPERSQEDWLKLTDEVLTKWQAAQVASEKLAEVSEVLPDYEIAFNRDQTQIIPRAYAQEEEVQITAKEEIIRMIDKAPPGGRVKAAAKIWKTDSQTAYKKLQAMRNQIASEAVTTAQINDIASKTTQVIATGSQVVLFVSGTGASLKAGELAVLGATGQLGNLANLVTVGVGTASMIFDISETAVNVGVSSDKGAVATLGKAKEAGVYKIPSFLLSVKDVGKALLNGKKLYEQIKNLGGGKITGVAVAAAAKQENTKTLIKDSVGNGQTVYNWGAAAWDYFTKNPDAKGIELNPQENKVIIAGSRGSQLIFTSDPQTIKAIGDFFKTVSEQPSSAPSSAGQPAMNEANQPEKPSYNGSYSGSTEASSGIAQATITVEGESLFGRATYRETKEGQTFRIGLNISGSVNEEGHASGQFSGSETVEGKTVTVSGTFSGDIDGSRMSIRFRASSSATGDTSGNFTLSK